MMLAAEKLSLLELVRKWGDINTDGLLEDSCQAFQLPDTEGFIGYRIEGANAVVFGDPVCGVENRPAFAKAFHEYCEARKLGIVYTIISQEFANWLAAHQSASTIHFGEKYIFNPQVDLLKNTGSKAVLLRKKVKHALKQSVSVQEYLEHNSEIEKQIVVLGEEWVKKRQGPQIYLAHLSLFQNRLGKRWFYAMHNDRVIGFLTLNVLQAKEGWLLNNLILDKGSPSGVSELLIITTLQALAKENCHYVLTGPVPASKLGHMEGVGAFPAAISRWVYKAARYIFNLEGGGAYWHKYQPRIEPACLGFPHRNLGISSIKSLLKAYNVGQG